MLPPKLFRSIFLDCQQCASQKVLVVKNTPTNAGDMRGDVRDMGLIPGLGRYPGYTPVFLLENPMDRGAWQVHRVAKSRIRLKRLSTAHSTTMSVGVAGIDEQGPETLTTL